MNVYCICEQEARETGPCKIGVAENVGRRRSNLQAGNWRPLVVEWQIELPNQEDARSLEGMLLGLFRPSVYTPTDQERLPSEWVSAAPADVYARAKQYADAVYEYEVPA